MRLSAVRSQDERDIRFMRTVILVDAVPYCSPEKGSAWSFAVLVVSRETVRGRLEELEPTAVSVWPYEYLQ